MPSKKWRGPKPTIRAAKPAEANPPGEVRIFGEAACTITAAEGEAKLATFRGIVYTGAVMKPGGWYGDVIIDLTGIIKPEQIQPALQQHDMEKVVGHTTKVMVTKAGVEIEGVFSGQQERVDAVLGPALKGFPWQLSVGADPIRTEHLEAGEKAVVNGREVTGPLTICRQTRLGENSFVPLGADRDTSVSVAAQKGQTMNPWKEALKEECAVLRAAGKKCHTDAEIDNMSADEARGTMKKYMKEARAADGDDKEDDDDEDDKKKKKDAKAASAASLKAAADGVMADLRRDAAAEHVRQSAISAAVKKYGVDQIEIDGADGKKVKVNLTAHAIELSWTPEKAELTALRAARPGAGVGVPGGLGYSTSTPQVSGEVLEAALLHAARHQFRLDDDDFYTQPTPDGTGTIRRVPMRLQKEVQGELKARYTDQVQQTAHTLFKGRMGPQQLLIVGLRAMGCDQTLELRSEGGIRSALQAWDHLERTGIKAEGASNLSISNILANVLNKFALQGYLFVEQAWRDICGIRSVNDFKPVKSINLLGDVMFKALGPVGELNNASLEDQAFANIAAPYGRIVTIPWTHLVNDDLGMLTGVPLKLGQGAGLALNDYIWSLWASLASGSVVNSGSGNFPSGASLNGDDGNAFWRTSSSLTAVAKKAGTAYNLNKISGVGSPLSASSLLTAKKTFDNQVDPNGNPLGFDASTPILLFGPSNWVTAMELMHGVGLVYGGSAASRQPNLNVWQGVMRPVMSRYIENANYGNSTTAFWILFDPAALPVIEACFLNGVDTPAVLQASPDYQFDKLGISIRGTMPFGANQQNFRGGVYSVGA